jgi:long-chain fatty acid transport protein
VKKSFGGIVLVCLLLGCAPLSQGAGFLIYEHGAAAMAMGGAFVAVANDPSAVFHNPAGIAFLKGTRLSVGTTRVSSTASMTLPNWPYPTQRNWEQVKQAFYPSTFYLTHSLSDRVTLGFGFFSPYGLGAEWPKDNPLRYLGYKDDMQTFFFNPAIAVKVADNLSVGFGVSYIYSTVKFKLVELKDFGAYGKYDVPAALDGNGNSVGFNAGVLYKTGKLSLGLNWRSQFNIKYSGDLTLDTSTLPAPLKPYVPTSAVGETTFKFPNVFCLGLAYNVTEKLLLSADFHYLTWSRFDKYAITFDNPNIAALDLEQNWDNSYLLRGGAQYSFSPKFALRGGILYDTTPQPKDTADPLLPDANRLALTGGFGINITGNLVLDFAFQHEMFSDRTVPNRYIYQVGTINLGEGTYETTANLIGLSLRYAF